MFIIFPVASRTSCLPEPPAACWTHRDRKGWSLMQVQLCPHKNCRSGHSTWNLWGLLPSEAAFAALKDVVLNLRGSKRCSRQLTKKEHNNSPKGKHMTGNGKQLFHFFHLRCSSANELRESMKPDGREAFRSLNVLPQNNAQHSLFRTAESVTTHSVHWVFAFVQESGFVKDLGEFLGRNQGPWIWGARISIANHKDVLEIDHKKWWLWFQTSCSLEYVGTKLITNVHNRNSPNGNFRAPPPCRYEEI